VVATALLGALAAAGCGPSNGSSAGASRPVALAVGSNDRATLTGAGSTFAATMVDEWIRLYRRSAPGVDIRYQPVGSGTGIRRLTSGAVDFAVTEVPMTAAEQQSAGWADGVVQLPLVGGAVAVAYNLAAEMDGLRLSEDTLAGIFSGVVNRWDHPAMRRDNPDRQLPSTPVRPVHRSDPSGSTLAFTRHLRTAGAGAWAPGEGASLDWPAGTAAAGSAGVLAAVGATAGSIGYVAAGPARAARLRLASLRNPAGDFVDPTPTAVDAALIGAVGVKEDLTLTLPVQPTLATAYPVTAISHLVFPVGLPAEKDAALRHLATWILTEGQRSTSGLGFAALPLPLLVRTLEGLQQGGVKPRR
jgi:phosphate transport system substrate-binding protein